MNKFLAEAGIASRRAADELIARGAVTIGGRRARIADQVDAAVDEVRVHGRLVRPNAQSHVTIALNKPPGVVTTMRDERGRRSIADFLPKGRRLFPVGRLDAQTTGLIICTSDGELCRKLSHPSFEVPRRYRVQVAGVPSAAAKRALNTQRVESEEGGAILEMILTGGKNREIRRACAQHGLRVIALQRIAYGPVELRSLKPGKHRVLSERELQLLKRALKAD